MRHGCVGAACDDRGKGHLRAADLFQELRDLLYDVALLHPRLDEDKKFIYHCIDHAGGFPEPVKLFSVFLGAQRGEDVLAVDHLDVHRVAYCEHVYSPDAVVEGDLSPEQAEVLAAAPEGASESLMVVPFCVKGNVAEGPDDLFFVKQGRHSEAFSVLIDRQSADAFIGMGVQFADVFQVRRGTYVQSIEASLFKFFRKLFYPLGSYHDFSSSGILWTV